MPRWIYKNRRSFCVQNAQQQCGKNNRPSNDAMVQIKLGMQVIAEGMKRSTAGESSTSWDGLSAQKDILSLNLCDESEIYAYSRAKVNKWNLAYLLKNTAKY